MIRRLMASLIFITIFYINLYEGDTNGMLTQFFIYMVYIYVVGNFEDKKEKK